METSELHTITKIKSFDSRQSKVYVFSYYSSLQTSELGVTEHVEGDPCKFALWVGRTPTSDNKIVLKVKHSSSSLLCRLLLLLGWTNIAS